MLLFYKCSHCFCGRSESSFPQKSYALWSKWICLVSLYLKWVKVYVELIKVRCGLNPLKLRLITNYACSLKRQISEDFFPNPISCWRNHNLYYEYMCGIDYDMVRPILCMTRATILLGRDLDKIWASYGRKKNWEWGFHKRDEGAGLWILKFEFISSRDAL